MPDGKTSGQGTPLSSASHDGHPEEAAGLVVRQDGAPASIGPPEGIQPKAGAATRRFSQMPMAKRIVRAPEVGASVAALLIYGFFAIAGGGKGFMSVTGTASWLNTASQLGII